MTSVRPYLVRALVEWIADNGQTPHVVVDCSIAGVQAPVEHAESGKLVLNVSAGATRNLAIGDDWLDVDCRFGGEPVHVRSPVGAVVAVYSRESGMGWLSRPRSRRATIHHRRRHHRAPAARS